MVTVRSAARAIAVCGVLSLSACGSDDAADTSTAAPTTTTSTSASGGSPAGATACDDVRVPGHRAVDVEATGTPCGTAEGVAAAAEGRGRAPYEKSGFACEGTDASGGDTTYACTMGDARIVFLYGTG